MKLLLDVGNSSCRRAGYDGVTLHHYPMLASDDYTMFAPTDISACIQAVFISSVRDDAFNRCLQAFVLQESGIEPVFVHTQQSACGITTRYAVTELGVDRFLALIGAWQLFKKACIVVDCGTATTIDVVDGDGIHQGGMILPGLAMLKEGLLQKTDRLLPGGGKETLFPCNTDDAIDSGCRRILFAAIMQTVQDMNEKVNRVFVASGSGGEWLAGKNSTFHYHPHLVIEGLALLSD